MIKQLITDIAHDTIPLSKALTRAKLIANRVKNESFKQWIAKELQGYDFKDELLPDYRKVRCVTYLTAEFPFGQKQTFPVSFEDETDKALLDLFLYHRVIEPVTVIEHNLETVTTPLGKIPLTPEIVEMLGRPYQQSINQQRGILRSGHREVGKVQYVNILELTTQKLLDTLLELDNQFPNLENEFTMSKENEEKVQNIITTNIYGDNATTNTAAGVNVEQHINITLKQDDVDKLKSYGVTDEAIEQLKTIIEDNHKDKPSLVSKAMKWLGGVVTAVATKGFVEHIPAITDFVHKLIA